MFRWLRVQLVVAGLLLGLSPAFGIDRESYLFWRTAEFVDDDCMVLSYIERRHASAQVLVAGSTDFADLMLLNTPDDPRPPLDAEAQVRAKELGCDSDARQLLDAARARFFETVYIDIVLALHFDVLPAGHPMHRTLLPAERAAAGGFDQLVRRFVGDSYASFVEGRRQAALAALPASQRPVAGTAPGPLASGERDTANALLGRVGARLGLLVAQQAIELAGLALREVELGGSDGIRVTALLHPQLGQVATFAGGPYIVETDRGDLLYGLLLADNDNRTIFTLMGAGSESVGQSAAAMVMVGPEQGPERPGTPAWRDGSEPFGGQRVALRGCLATACFQFPRELSALLLENARVSELELWLSPAGQPFPPKGQVSDPPNLVGGVALLRALQSYVLRLQPR